MASVRKFRSFTSFLGKLKTHSVRVQSPNSALFQVFWIVRDIQARKKRGYEWRFGPVQKTSE